MKLQKLLLLLPLSMLPAAAILLGFSSGPLPKLTGGFREETCLQCHGSFKLNEGRTIGGVFEIHGVPKTYEPGKVYNLTVVIGQPGQSRWGFEISVRHVASGKQAGTLLPVDAMSQVKETDGIQYLEHTSAGTREKTPDGPVEFPFTWTAPDTAGGPVFFSGAGNAADGSNTPAGDYIFTASAYSGVAGGAGNVPLPKAARPEAGRNGRLRETSKLLDLPSPANLDRGTIEIHIQHRFFQSISDATPGNAFGIDSGANINLGVNYAFTDRLSAGISRARFDQLIAINSTYELQTRRTSFWKMSLHAAIEGKENFERQFSPILQLPTSFDYKALRLNVVPTAIFNSRDDRLVAADPSQAINPGSNHTFSLGLGVDLALSPRFSLSSEVVPRLAGFGGFGERRTQVGGGFTIRTSAHVFTILVATSRDFNPSKYAVNSENSDVCLGFNIYRRIR